ncbi:hypothetical protein AB1286_27735 [Trinickia sp. NRRL B-1857]|uniref:hypothetical protein n=1 Tax=Trinickia sp. NRRL B-1857 TaxID=3162879 RepID=UPI003D2C0B3C
MTITRDVPAPVSHDDFASQARIEVRYLDRPLTMPLARLDRLGLTVTVDDADQPAIGLPRRALIVADGETLCELRLVARRAKPLHGGTFAVTLQPSRADDHALLWQALRAYQIHLGAVASGDESARWTCPATAEPACTASHNGRMPCGADSEMYVRMEANERGRATASVWAGEADPYSLVSCDAAFTLASPEDAWFFSHWLDYHFAEIRAWARTSDATADLREIFMRVVDHEVEIRFVFRCTQAAVRGCAETACSGIEAEAARQLGMTVEHWLSGSTASSASPIGWCGRGTVRSSRAGSYSFSSK